MLAPEPRRQHRTRWTVLALLGGIAVGFLVVTGLSFAIGQVRW